MGGEGREAEEKGGRKGGVEMGEGEKGRRGEKNK